MRAHATYDPEADAIGISFRADNAEYRDSAEVAPGLTLDFDTAGRVIGVEILGVKRFLADGEIQSAGATPRDRKRTAAA
jgi:uncharacterized protein YuzE